MQQLTRWFIHNPVAANLIMVLILLAGLLTVYSIRIEGFPKLPADTIVIETTFIDAYTTQVDEHITQKIESALEGLQGVKYIQSSSLDGLSSIQVRKKEGYDLQRLLDDVRARLDGINDLPKDAEKPIITRNDFDFPALYIQLHSQKGMDADQQVLQRLSRRLKETLLEQPEISRLNIWGLKNPEIRIEITPENLEKYDLTITDITEKIQSSSLLFKAGELKTSDGNISIRADNQAYYQNDFAKIPLLTKVDGTLLSIGDIAEIQDEYEDNDVVVRFNGTPSIGMEVLIGRKENLLEISRVVKSVTAEFKKSLPDNVTLSVWGDSSHYISERLNLLKDNALQGLILVVIILALFLNLKLAFWVAMGIPISFAGAVAVMGSQWVNYSLNDVTTFGLIIALGILVDDAVVVGESVFEQRKNYNDPKIGTEKGVEHVATATIFGVLTTVAALYPMLLIDNALGKVLASFAGVVILALLFSLFESKFILPAHLAHISLNKPSDSNWNSRKWLSIQNFVQGLINKFKHNIYTPLLRGCLQQRYAVVIIFVSMAMLGIGLMGYGKIRTVLFPDIPGQIITINMEMDARAPYRLISENVDRIEEISQRLNATYRKEMNLQDNPIQHILVVINGAFSAEIYAELTPIEQHKNSRLGTLEILDEWRQQVGVLEGVTEISFTGSENVGGGFEIQVLSKDGEDLQQASDVILKSLQSLNGVNNIRDTLKSGKPEIHLKLKPETKHFGFTVESLATQIGSRYGGAEAQRIQRDHNEVKVLVQSSKQARQQFESLLNARIKNKDGRWFPLSDIADFRSSYATDYLARHNGKRVNSIRAYVDKKTVAPAEIAQGLKENILPALKEKYPHVEIRFAGEIEQEGELKGGLLRALIFTCALIYVLLAIPLKSYWQPLIIMSVVPFGFVGAAIGHLIMGYPLSILSFFGMLALAGVVVNDSLVLVSRYNQASDKEGASTTIHEQIIKTSVGRFQAVFLTTATTVAGLMPLMQETSEQAQYLIPAAISLAYGEIFATTITLILIPVLIAISTDIRAPN